ncbi:lysophospholipid acyltransferase family protein [Maioricimonas rarisocia]|uniref:lysophospholipid acyltransferase family protein n=1 Tax=Maioricimonas rarisocia TaxID=2528026 RepID=UPI0011A5C2A3|nr:lysophospholipid acyltransferase family protein [Maioricimonas rarisocia]
MSTTTLAAPPSERLSYAAGVTQPWRRTLIRLVERAMGVRSLLQLYDAAAREAAEGVDPFLAGKKHLDVQVDIEAGSLDRIPATGPLLIVSNHPFGAVDGLILCSLVTQVRKDFRILLNHVASQIHEIEPWILPIDFRPVRESREVNLQSRKKAIELLQEGGCLVLFPAGSIATTETNYGLWGSATEREWTPFTSRLILKSQPTVLPIYISGQNSRLFQVASHVSPTLRAALLVREISNKKGRRIGVRIGEPIDTTTADLPSDRQELADLLQQRTLALAGD